MKTCCFFGHRRIDGDVEALKVAVAQKIEALIEEGFDCFLFGGYGQFDRLCLEVTDKLKTKYGQIQTVFVMAYYPPPDAESLQIYDQTLFVGTSPRRYSIITRNTKMVKMADFCIFFVKYSWGGAYKAMKQAQQKCKPYTNLAHMTT